MKSLCNVLAAIGLVFGVCGGNVLAQDVPPPDAVRPDTTERPGEGVWANYDFVPGHRVLYSVDFSEGFVGDVPRSIGFESGTMETVEWEGGRYLRTRGDAQFTIPLDETLPERFTLETSLHIPRNATVAFLTEDTDDELTESAFYAYYEGSYFEVQPGTNETGVMAQKVEAGEAFLESTGEALREGFVPVRVMVDGDYVKMYLGAERIANVPNAKLTRTDQLEVRVFAASEEHVYFDYIRVAEGGRTDLYDDLRAEGRVATRGILFDTGSAEIRPESTPTLRDIARMLEQHPDVRLRIEGHTDARGSDESNQTLSQRRAEAVEEYLVSEYGIDAARLEAEGRGESEPVASNETPEGRQSNRRVELVRVGAEEPSTQDRSSESASDGETEPADVSPEELAALLPPEIAGGFQRTDLQSGVRQGEPGAQATYEGSEGTFDITLGAVSEDTRSSLQGMLEMQASRDDALDSITYEGHPGFEGSMQKRQQILIIVGDRVMVRVGTDGAVSMSRLRAALDALDHAAIERLAGHSAVETDVQGDLELVRIGG